MPYLNRSVENVISVKKLVCFFAHEYIGINESGGERHDFWEMVYVEEGELVEMSGDVRHHLRAGDVVFHKPNVFHRTINPNGMKVKAYDISFQCASRAMDFFKDYKGTLSASSRQIARLLAEEGRRSFVPYNTPKGDHTIAVKKDAPIGGQQMYRIYLEALLINILREQTSLQPLTVFASKDDFQKTLHVKIVEYLKENMGSALSLPELCKRFNYSNTFLCTKFKEQSGESIMHCFNRLKIEEACRLMNNNSLSLADISTRLGFNNPYYFSRVFKRIKGISPSEFRKALY